MRHKDELHPKKYIRRVTSNGEDVYPTVCATQYKGVQQQMDKGGYYILDYLRKKKCTHFTTESKI
jgi:hypothetical protein